MGRESPRRCAAIACTWLRSRSVVRGASVSASLIRASMSTAAHISWPSRASVAWPTAKVGSSAMALANDCPAPLLSRSSRSTPRLKASAASAEQVSG